MNLKPNIKQHAINYIKAKLKDDPCGVTDEFNKIVNYINKRKEQIVSKYAIHNVDEASIMNKADKFDKGLYLEIQFLSLINKLDGDIKIEKIPTCKYKTPDFLVKSKFNHPLALVECTTFELSEKDTWLLNKPLATVMNTPLYLLPEFIVPEQFLTLLLGFNEFKRKVREKVTQFDTYIEYNSDFQGLQKFIILDMSWFVFDMRILNASLIDQILPKWRETFLRGEGNEKQTKLLNLIREIRDTLKDKNITILCTVNGMHDVMLEKVGCFIAITAESIFPFLREDVIKFNRVSPKTIYELNFDEFIEDHWCENQLFYSTKYGKVFCPRFDKFINGFINSYFDYQLSRRKFPNRTWLKRLAKEIRFFNSLNQKCYAIPNILCIQHYDELLAELLLEDVNFNLQDKCSLAYLKLCHYVFENLYFKLKSQHLIGDEFIHYEYTKEYKEDYYNFYKTKFLSLHENENEFKDKWYQTVEKLGLYEFNRFHQPIGLYYQIIFHFI